jgi:hypothetical protein
VRKKGIWISQYDAMRWSDSRTSAAMHAHTIDAAQEGFSKAFVVTRALRRAGFERSHRALASVECHASDLLPISRSWY